MPLVVSHCELHENVLDYASLKLLWLGTELVVACSDPAIKASLDKVTGGSADEYAVFGYVPKTSKLKTVGEGSGWDDMSEEMVRSLPVVKFMNLDTFQFLS